MNKESLEFWDKRAETYEHFYTLDTVKGKQKAERKYKKIMSGIKAGDSVLELGCGTGLLTEKLAQRFYVHAIDQSPNMVAIAKKKVPLANIEVGDAEQINCGNQRFDAVVGSYILQYLDLELALPEIYRVLKTGGYVAFTAPNVLNPLMLLLTKSNRVKQLYKRPQLNNSYNPIWLKNKFVYYGFNDVKIVPTGFTPAFINNNRIDIIAEKVPIIKWLAGNLLIKARK